MLACECSDDAEGWYEIGDELTQASKDFKCYGCCTKGVRGDPVRVIELQRTPDDDEFEQGMEDPITEGYQMLCEPCGDLYDSLSELGFCIAIDWGFIPEAMSIYRQEYSPKVLSTKHN